jgi:citrate synthase
MSRRDVIEIAGRDIVSLIGETSLTGAFLLALDGEMPSAGRQRVVDAVLVSIMDHGITPSSLTTRLVLDGAPESTTGAVAAGLLAVGSRFLGTIEDAAILLRRIVETAGGDSHHLHSAAGDVVADLTQRGERIPGLGHNLHRSSDPRVERLLTVAREEGVASVHVAAFECLPAAAATHIGELIPNAAGAIGAIVLDLGYEPAEARSFALVARCAGLVVHAVDERRTPIARGIWESARANEQTDEPADG